MTSQHRIQQYMEKHKVARLFEDLMNKVIHDQPDDPLVYLIKVLCKKAGKEVPPEAKLSHLRRSTSDLPRAQVSPEMSRKNRPLSSTWANQDVVARPYEKPWMSKTKKGKPRKPGEQDDHARPVSAYIKPSLGPTLSPTIRRASLDEFLRIKPISPGRRQKNDWNADTKAVPTNFDELFDDAKGGKSRNKTGTHNPRRAWASYGLGDGEENLFSSSGYRGPKKNKSEEDPLSGELISPSYKRGDTRETTQRSTASSVSGRVKGPRISAKKHRQELEKLIRDSDKRSTDSGIYDDREDGNNDEDAIELLEDADILRKEGVKKIPSRGYKLSRRTVRQADPEVKLNINLYTGSGPMPSQQSAGPRYGELSDYDDSEREGSLIGSRYTPESDEEFESVSQVTGPRHPIWTAPDSDGEVPAPRPPLASSSKAVTMALPYRSEDFDRRSPLQGRLASASPYRSADIYSSRSVNRDDLYRPNTQESMDMYEGTGGGWAVRDGSDVSQTDWKGTRKVRPSKPVDYRSY